MFVEHLRAGFTVPIAREKIGNSLRLRLKGAGLINK